MALGTLPYKFRISSKAVDPGNTDVTVTFDILDGANAVLVTAAKILVSPATTPEAFFDAMRVAVIKQMMTDAGGAGPLLTAMISKVVPVNQ